MSWRREQEIVEIILKFIRSTTRKATKGRWDIKTLPCIFIPFIHLDIQIIIHTLSW